MSEHDELTEQIGGFVEAYTGYHKDEGKTAWSMDVHHTVRVVADVDGMIAQIIALVRADERRRIREALLSDDFFNAMQACIHDTYAVLATEYGEVYIDNRDVFTNAALAAIGLTEEQTS